MREFLTGDDLFAEVLLLRDQGKLVVLVEGPDDVDALDAHVSEESSFLIPGYGKSSVEYAIGLADAQKLDFVLAILDRDWVGIIDAPHPSPNVVYTDMYDLDATIIFTGDACRRVVSNFCDKERLKRHMTRSGAARPTEFIVKPAIAVGVLRLLTCEMHLAVKVRDFPITEIMDMSTGEPDIVKMIVIANSKYLGHDRSMDKEGTAQLVKLKISEAGSDVRYCSGHDLSVALAGIMRRKWGCTVKAEVVIKAIRAAFACGNLMMTSLYREVERWAANRGAAVWTCPPILAPDAGRE